MWYVKKWKNLTAPLLFGTTALEVGPKSTTLQTRALLVYMGLMPKHNLQARNGISLASANISGTIGANKDSTKNDLLLTKNSWNESLALPRVQAMRSRSGSLSQTNMLYLDRPYPPYILMSSTAKRIRRNGTFLVPWLIWDGVHPSTHYPFQP